MTRRRLGLALVLAPLLLGAAPAVAQPDTVVAPGVSYRSFQRGSSVAYVARVQQRAAASTVPSLAGGRLAGFATTSAMARGSGAVLAVNGDFALSSGRPVHAFAAAGVLAQTAQLPGRGLGLTPSGAARIGFPDERVAVLHGDARLPAARWNSGPPAGDEVVGFTGAGRGLETAPDGACYAALAPQGQPHVDSGRVLTPMEVRRTGCAAHPPAVPAGGAVLVARRGAPFRALPGRVTLEVVLGGGAWSLLGASEALVVDGRVNAADVDQPGAYVQQPAPRTAVGVTGHGTLLLVVVDGRRPGSSTGMSLRQLARLLVDLGARQAVNLDGGGSSTMWVRGRVVNRPSDGAERGVSSALLVMPTGAGRPTPLADPVAAWQAAARDPASTGGLALPGAR